MAPPLHMTRYTVSTSNDLGSHKVTISNAQKAVVWTQERELVGAEIIESLRDVNDRPLYDVHRPTRGWYIVIRSPHNKAPKAFVSLQPSSAHSPSHLGFSLHRDTFTSPDRPGTTDRIHFLLQPHLPAHEKRQSSGLGHISSLFANRKNTFSLVHSQGGSAADQLILSFEDTTSVLASSTSGHLFVDESAIAQLDIAPSAFFVCAALAYLEFEEDAAAYHAANEETGD